MMRSIAQVVTATDPVLAHRLAPGDGRIMAMLAASRMSAEATGPERERAAALARAALRRDATAVPALSVLGLDAEARGAQAQALRIFSAVQALSRRDLPTQLWWIEQAVAQGDTAGALRHYDIALRTEPASGTMLFPTLAAALAEPAVRAALVGTLTARPLWGSSFIAYAASQGPDPRATAALLLTLQGAGLAAPAQGRAAIIDRLIGRGDLAEAWRVYSAFAPGAARDRSRAPRSEADIAASSLLDWVPVQEDGIVTSIQRGPSGWVFDIFAPAGVGGPLLRQGQLLPPGRYRLSGHAPGLAQEPPPLPYWVLICGRDGRELGRVPLPPSAGAGGGFAGTFTVPDDCPMQMLTLIAPPSDAVAGLSGQIDDVQLRPAR